MATFSQRIRAAVEFEDEVERFLERHDDIRIVSRNGTEHIHPRICSMLAGHNDRASKFVRFAPDGIALPTDDTLFHWEAKYSMYIERDAYEAYCSLEQIGCRVLIFMRTAQAVYTSWASALPFVPSEQVVAKYPLEKRFPIADGWIHPRLAENRCDLIVGSGTPFRQIDIELCDRLMDLTKWQQTTRTAMSEAT